MSSTNLPNLDQIFLEHEEQSDVAVNEKIAADKAINAALADIEFKDALEFEEAEDGKFYPLLREEDVQYFANALNDFVQNGLGKDLVFNKAVVFFGSKMDAASNFRGRSFFIAEEPIQDAAKGVSVNFARTFTRKIMTTIPGADNSHLNHLYKYFRNYIYQNMFRIGDLDKPEGWHVFSQNGFRLDFTPLANVTADTPGSQKGIFSMRYTYNTAVTGDEGEDQMFIAGMGHNHIVLHQTAMIDNPDDKGGGDHFSRFMAYDPEENEEGQKDLPTHNHEVIPASAVKTFHL